MYGRIISLLIILLPLLAQSQDGGRWTMYVNRKAVAYDTTGKAQTVRLKQAAKGEIRFRFSAIDTAIIRTVMVMDEERIGIDSKLLKRRCKSVAFAVKDLYTMSKGRSFSFYTADKPADPAKAMLVRMAPVLFCTIAWTQ